MQYFGMVLITALLAYLKVAGYLAISWLWVFAPVWLGGAMALVFILLFLIFAAIGAAVSR